MYAYLRYLDDDVRVIVHVSHIQNFSPSSTADFSKNKIYYALWNACEKERIKVRGSEDMEENFYKSQILLLDDTLLELRAAIQKSRIPVTKIRISDEESETDDDYIVTSKKSVKDVQAVKKLRTSEVTTDNFKEILKEKKKELKKNSLFARSKSSKNYITDDSTDEEHKKVASAELEVRYKKIMLAYKKKDSEASEAKEEVKMLREKLLKQEDELRTLRELNVELQHALLGKLGTAQPPPTTPPGDAMPADVPSLHSTRQRFSIEDGKVFLGGNIFLEKGKWDVISNNVKDTIFVKDLATAIWGKDNLKGRSLEGIPCNRLKSQGATSKPALSPEKLAVVKDTFEEWLRNKNVPEEEILLRTKKYKSYISDKIMYINRKCAKESAVERT